MPSDSTQQALDHLAALAEFASGPLERLKHYSKIEFTGVDPSNTADLEKLTNGRSADEGPELLVIGSNGFSKSVIRKWVQRCDQAEVHFLPQEGFFDWLLFNYNWWTDDHDWLDRYLHHHEGLKYLKSLEGFEWPSTEAEESGGSISNADIEYQETTDLFDLGYYVGSQPRRLSQRERRKILDKAVTLIGLELTAKTIANHSRSRKRQQSGKTRYKEAIGRWEGDLRWLRQRYAAEISFKWPSSEP